VQQENVVCMTVWLELFVSREKHVYSLNGSYVWHYIIGWNLTYDLTSYLIFIGHVCCYFIWRILSLSMEPCILMDMFVLCKFHTVCMLKCLFEL
jgi:hypothetical protein